MPTKAQKIEQINALRSMDVVCHLTRVDVGRIVVQFIRSLGFPAATEASNFTTDVPVDATGRRAWAVPIRRRIFEAGCDPKAFGPNDCEKAKKVKNIADSAFKEIQ